MVTRTRTPGPVATAALGLTCAVLGWVLLLGSAGSSAPLTALAQVLTTGVGPALVSASAVALLRRGGVLTAAGGVVATSGAAAAWALAAASALSWGVGFDEADAGVPASPLATAFPVLAGAALALGALALTPLWAALLRRVRPRWARRALAVACAVPTAAVVGVSAVAPAVWPLLGVGALAVAVRSDRRPTAPPTVAVPVPGPGRGGARVLPRRRVAVLSAVSAGLGLPCAAHVLLGGPLGPVSAALTGLAGRAPLPAVNAGLAAGSVAAVPLLVALGTLAAHRWGPRLHPSTGALVAAALLTGAGQAQGPHGSSAPLALASLLAALGLVLPFRDRLPGGVGGRWALTAVLCAALSLAGVLPLVVVLPLAAPPLAVVVALWAVGVTGPRARAAARNA